MQGMTGRSISEALRDMVQGCNGPIDIYCEENDVGFMHKVVYFIHPNPTIVLLKDIQFVDQRYSEVYDGLRVNEMVHDEHNQVVIVPCQALVEMDMMLHLIIGKDTSREYTIIRKSVVKYDRDVRQMISGMNMVLGTKVQVQTRYPWKSVYNKHRDAFNNYSDAIQDGLRFMVYRCGHPVISRATYVAVFQEMPWYDHVFNKLIVEEFLKPGKSMKYSKDYELRVYDEPFTFLIEQGKAKMRKELPRLCEEHNVSIKTCYYIIIYFRVVSLHTVDQGYRCSCD